MSARRRLVTAAGVTLAAAGGVAASVYGLERRALRALERRPDPDAGTLDHLDFDEAVRLPSHDGGSVYTVSRGAGPPILFSHGVTISSRIWVKQFRLLPDRGVRVLAFDHRGHGQSTTGATGHSVANLAADTRTVLEGLDLRDAILVGHSMGGVAVQAFALEHPDVLAERVRGIVLLSTLARTSVAHSRSLRWLAEQVTGVIDLAPLMGRPNVGTLAARSGFGRRPQASWVELNRELLAACPRDTVRDATAALLGLDLVADLARLDVPTLVIGGSADVITPPAEVRRVARAIPAARLVMLDGAGHNIMLERTEQFHDLLVGFARDVGALAAAGAA